MADVNAGPATNGAPLSPAGAAPGAADTTQTITTTTQAQPPKAPDQVPGGGIKVGNNIVVPEESLKKRLEREKAKGRAELLAQLDEEAKAAGYGSHQERMTVSQRRAQQQPEPRQEPSHQQPPKGNKQGKNDGRQMHENQALRDKAAREKSEMQKRLDSESRRRREEQRRADEQEVLRGLERIIVSKGVTKPRHIDFMIHSYRQHLKTVPAEQLEQQNEGAFFDDMKKEYPEFFNGRVEQLVPPATTGPGASGIPAPLAPGNVTRVNAGSVQSERERIKGLNPEQFKAELRKRGLHPTQ